MYCPNCGKEVEAGDRFCKYCSFNLSESAPDGDGRTEARATENGPRSTGLAMFLSVILPGTGAYYIDGNATGIVIFLVSFVLLLGLFLLPILFPLFLLVMLVMWAIGLKVTSDSIDSYRQKYPL